MRPQLPSAEFLSAPMPEPPDLHFFKAIVANANDIVIVTEVEPSDEPGPRIVYVNQALLNLTGYTEEEIVGRTPRILQGPKTSAKTRQKVREALERREPVRVEILNYAKDGAEYWLDMSIFPLHNADGKITHFGAIERDITQQKTMAEELARLANTDPLTGLDNRRAFMTKAQGEYERARRYARPLGILQIDIDHFKAINDSHGHHSGDEILRVVGLICRASLRSADIAGRLGGEEFAILLPEAPLAEARIIGERLRSMIEAESGWNRGREVDLTVSIGATELCCSDHHINDALRRADAALYEAKRLGRNRVAHNGCER